MRRISVIMIVSLLFVSAATSLAQDRISSIAALPDTSRLSVTSMGNGIVKIYNKLSGMTTIKNISNYGSYDSTAANLVVNINAIDTAQYSQMYSLWKTVPVAGWYPPPVVSDEDHNGNPEITGKYLQYGQNPSASPTELYEAGLDSNFYWQHTYPGGGPLYVIDSSDSRPSQVLTISPEGGMQDFISPSASSLSTVLNYTYNPGGSVTTQLNTPVFFHDHRGNFDVVYFYLGGDTTGDTSAAGYGLSYHVAQYDSSINNFNLMYHWRGPALQNTWGWGFAVGDLNMDGKTEIATGTVDGNVMVMESNGDGTYSEVWSGSVPTYNAWLALATHNIDGTPQFWIGGDAYYNGTPMTVLTCFQSNGNNQFTPVYTIDIIGIVSFYAENILLSDIENNGGEDIVLCLDQTVLIFKPTGLNQYELFYVKTDELANQGAIYTSVTTGNISDGGKPDLLIGLNQTDPSGSGTARIFTQIYRPDFITSVVNNPPGVPEKFSLYQNYPNPFNPSTVIKYNIPTAGYVTLKVYDVLGREIRSLVNERQPPGTYSAIFDASALPSGVYFYRLTSGSFVDTKKMLVLK